MFTRYLLSALVALASSSLVSAHGTITLVNIDGTTYAGPQPATNGGPGKSIVRQLSDLGPVKGASNPDLACGLGAHSPAALVAPAKPGSTVELQWMGAAGPWIHEVGPILTYMAQCTGTTCDKFDPKNAKWFKINEWGQKSDGTWYQADIKQGKSLTITLPVDLAEGEYLLRPELIALHNALTVGGAEMYPSCIQLRVSSSGKRASVDPTNTVSFPGAYKDDSPSLVVPDIYNPGFKYTMPGPKLSNLVSKVMKITAQLTGKDTGSAAAAAAGPGSVSLDAGSGAANAGASPSDAASSSESASTSTKAASSTVKATSTTKSTAAASTATSKTTSPSASSASAATTASSSSSSSAATPTHTKTCKRKRSAAKRMFAQEPAHFAKEDKTHEESKRMFAQAPAHFAKDTSASAGSRRTFGAHRQHRSRLSHNA